MSEIKFLSETELENRLPQWMDAVGEFKSRFRRIDLQRSALLVIDMQNEFLREDGLLPAWGGPAVIPRIKTLIHQYRKTGRPVIYTRHCYFNPEIDGGATAEWWNMDRDSPVLKASLPGAKIHDELAPSSGDLVLIKHRYSAFHGTNLETILKRFECGYIQLIITTYYYIGYD